VKHQIYKAESTDDIQFSSSMGDIQICHTLTPTETNKVNSKEKNLKKGWQEQNS
jgi:hypothetical protein